MLSVSSTNAPKFVILTTFPSIISPTSISLTIPSIIFLALYAFSTFSAAINTEPSSSISIFTPVSSMILFITLPPVPITSLIFSGSIVIEIILGAYLLTSSLGLSIHSNILFNMNNLPIRAFSNAAANISLSIPCTFMSI